MNSSLKLKIGLVLLLLVFCALALLPSLNPGLPDWWKKYMAPAGLKLGLDLQGGMHIVLQVDLDKAAEFAARPQARARSAEPTRCSWATSARRGRAAAQAWAMAESAWAWWACRLAMAACSPSARAWARICSTSSSG